MQTLVFDVIWMLELVVKGGGTVVPVLANRHMMGGFARSLVYVILADVNITFEREEKDIAYW